MPDAQASPGVELDHRMAEAFLPKDEWFVSSPRSDNVIVWNGQAWMPSTDLKDAWMLVQKMRAQKWDVTVIAYAKAGYRAIATASTTRLAGGESYQSAAHAICLCALEAFKTTTQRGDSHG